jgi:hypothetical protein
MFGEDNSFDKHVKATVEMDEGRRYKSDHAHIT